MTELTPAGGDAGSRGRDPEPAADGSGTAAGGLCVAALLPPPNLTRWSAEIGGWPVEGAGSNLPSSAGAGGGDVAPVVYGSSVVGVRVRHPQAPATLQIARRRIVRLVTILLVTIAEPLGREAQSRTVLIQGVLCRHRLPCDRPLGSAWGPDSRCCVPRARWVPWGSGGTEHHCCRFEIW